MNQQCRNLPVAGKGLSSAALKLFAFVFLCISFGPTLLHAQTVAYVVKP